MAARRRWKNCSKGHALTPENSYDQRGRIRRECKLCKAARFKEWKNKNKKRFARLTKDYIARNREKYRARRKLYKAIANENIERPSQCFDCQISCKPEGHHLDYTKPYDVRWLCRKCHLGVHRGNG